MIFERITNSAGIDDFKLTGETPQEKAFIQQLSAAGSLISKSTNATSSIVFSAISIDVNAPVSTLISRAPIGNLDFEIRQNQNFLVDLKFQTNNTPIDLTDYSSIKLQVKSSKDSGAIVTLTIGSGLTISGVDSNVLSIAFSSADTLKLMRDEYYYDILFVKPSSNNYMVEGKLSINRTVTT